MLIKGFYHPSQDHQEFVVLPIVNNDQRLLGEREKTSTIYNKRSRAMVYSVRKHEVYYASGNAANRRESIYAGTQEETEDTSVGSHWS